MKTPELPQANAARPRIDPDGSKKRPPGRAPKPFESPGAPLTPAPTAHIIRLLKARRRHALGAQGGVPARLWQTD